MSSSDHATKRMRPAAVDFDIFFSQYIELHCFSSPFIFAKNAQMEV
jgi:hypothetical protein